MRSTAIRNQLAIKSASFTQTDVAQGFFGFFDQATNTARRVWYSNQQLNQSDWTGVITGSSCIMYCGGGLYYPFMFSIDDGPFVNPIGPTGTTANNTVVDVFRGLPDSPHLVRIKINQAFNNNGYNFTSGPMFTVYGFNPGISFPNMGTKWMITDPSFPGKHAIPLYAQPTGANVLPANSDTFWNTQGASYAPYLSGEAIKIKAQCTDIWLYTGAECCKIWVDGVLTSETYFTPSSSQYRVWKKVATNLDGSAPHVYYIAPACDANNTTQNTTLGIMIGGSGASYSTLPATKTVIQYGDSITWSRVYTAIPPGIQVNSDCSIIRTGGALGALTVNAGYSGKLVAGLDADLASIRAGRSGVVEDVAIVAIGRNDWGVTTQSAFQTSYTSILNKLLTAGVPKILCRGTQCGQGNANATTVDGWISGAITTLGNANVIFIDTSSWTGIEGMGPNVPPGDGTHPTPVNGHTKLSTYEQTAYAAYIT